MKNQTQEIKELKARVSRYEKMYNNCGDKALKEIIDLLEAQILDLTEC